MVRSIFWMSLWRARTLPRTVLAAAVRLELSLRVVSVMWITWSPVDWMTYSCLEHSLVAPIGTHCFLDFSFCGLWVHDPVLSCDLLAVPSLVVGLLLSVLLQLLREAGLELPDLRILDSVTLAPRSIGL